MDNLSVLRLALIFSGCFLGAGYVSGQEMWQYFGSFGLPGYAGLAAAMLLIFLFGVMVIRLAQLTGLEEADRLMLPDDWPLLRIVIAVLELIMMFAVVSVMTAGVGALLEQLFSLSYVVGSILFSLLVLLTALSGLKGVASAFSVSAPLLVGITVIFGLISLLRGGNAVQSVPAESNRLLGSFLGAAINFASYNSFMTVAILAPFGRFVKKRRTTYLGIGLGTALIVLVALSVLAALSRFPEATLQELPMLFVASSFSSFGSYVYAFLLAAAMFGTALSSFVGAVHYLSEKFARIRTHYRSSCVLFCLVTFAASSFGFGDLISVLYPLFGYCSIAFLVLMSVNFAVKMRAARRQKM